MKIIPIDESFSQKHGSEYMLFFDSAGNAYLLALDGKAYQILIEKDNIILVYDKDFQFRKYDQQFKKLKLSSDPRSLKGKIIKEKEKEDDEQGEERLSDEEGDDELNIVRKMYPEDLEYYEENEQDTNEYDELDDFAEDDNFEFAFTGQQNNIVISDTDEYTAIYDTIVYNGSYQGNNVIVLKTTYCGLPLPYRLLIFSSGDFVIKTIAEQQIHNKLSEQNGEPCFVQIKREKIKLGI